MLFTPFILIRLSRRCVPHPEEMCKGWCGLLAPCYSRPLKWHMSEEQQLCSIKLSAVRRRRILCSLQDMQCICHCGMRFSKCWPRFQNYITQIPGDGAAVRTLPGKRLQLLPKSLMVLQFLPVHTAKKKKNYPKMASNSYNLWGLA